MSDLSTLPAVEVTTQDKEGNHHIYAGARLADVLDSAGVTLGKDLRGKNLAKYLLVRATDGYEAIFSLPEVDPEFTDDPIILAYIVDGNALPDGEGPFRIIVPKDKKGARWIRGVRTIKVGISE